MFAAELTWDAVFDALKSRRTVATQGQRIVIDFKVNHLLIGEEGVVTSPVTMALRVTAPRPLEFVDIIRDEVLINRIPCQGRTLSDEILDSPGPGQHCYRIRGKTEGGTAFNVTSGDRQCYVPFTIDSVYAANHAAAGPFAWTSPIWVHVE